MRSDIDATRFSVVLSRALCCKYLAVFFDCLCMQTCAGDVPEKCMLWALGVHDGGERELLGVWLAVDPASLPWREAFADLKMRGVESMRFVIGTGPEGMVGDLLRESFGAMTLPSIGSALAASLAQAAPRNREAVARGLRSVVEANSWGSAGEALRAAARSQEGVKYPQIVAQWRVVLIQCEPLFRMPAPRRRMVLSGDCLAQRLHVAVARSMGRQSDFAIPTEALDFVAGALLRAERLFDRQRVVEVARASVRGVGTVSGTAAQAFV